MLKWDRTMPLGSPVEPLEKITAAVSSMDGLRFFPRRRSIARTGNRHDQSSATSFSEVRGSLATDSSACISTPGGGVKVIFSRKALEVMMVRIEVCAAARRMLSAEAV